jgi:RNA polymerase sigma-70 factor (ECF subfamily)
VRDRAAAHPAGRSGSALRSRFALGVRHATVHGLGEAGAAGDLERLRSLLHPGVAVVVDRGEPDGSEVRVVHGQEDAATVLAHGLAAGPGVVVQERAVNSRPGLLVVRSGTPVAALAVDFTGALVSLVWVRLHPAPLRHGLTV